MGVCVFIFMHVAALRCVCVCVCACVHHSTPVLSVICTSHSKQHLGKHQYEKEKAWEL